MKLKGLLKGTVAAVLIVLLGLGGLGAVDFAAYRLTFDSPRWHTTYNNFVTAVQTEINAVLSSVSTLADLINDWAIEDNIVTMVTTTPTYVDGDTFTLSGDYTSRFPIGAVVQAQVAAGMVYSTVASSSYGAPTTTVNINDAVLTNPITRIYVVATRDGLWPNGPGYVVARDYGSDRAALEAADAVAAAAGKQLLITGSYTIDQAVTLSSPSVKVMPGAILTRSAGDHLTINGKFICGLTQCFADNTTNYDWVVFGSGSVTEVPVSWFGNDTGAITAALNATPSGATVRFNAGLAYTFSPSSNLVLSGKSIWLTCDPGVEIDATGATAAIPLDITGTTETFYALGADAKEGDITITVNAAQGVGGGDELAAGDMIQISTDSGAPVGGSGKLWVSGDPDYFKSEFCEVKSISGTTVTLKEPLADFYTTTDAMVGKINPISGGFRNFRMKATDSRGQFIRMSYLRDYELASVELRGISTQLTYGLRTIVDKSTISIYKGSGSTYGVMLAACQSAQVSNSRILGGFQAVSTGGRGVSRYISIGPGNTIVPDKAQNKAGVALHANADGVRIFENTIYGGVLGGSKNEVIENNNIYLNRTTDGYGIYVNATTGLNYPALIDAVNLLSSWSNGSPGYDTFTTSGANITSAINTALSAESASAAAITTVPGQYYKIVATLTLNSGQGPTLAVTNPSKSWVLDSGANYLYYRADGTSTVLTVSNSTSGDWSCTFVVYAVDQPFSARYTNNRIYGAAQFGVAANYGIIIYNATGSIARCLDISGNTMRGNIGGIKITKGAVTANPGERIETLRMLGNDVDLSQVSGGYLFYPGGYAAGDRLVINNLIVDANKFRFIPTIGIYTQHFNCSSAVINNNSFHYDGPTGTAYLYLTSTTTIDLVDLINNKTYSPRPLAYFAYVNCGSSLIRCMGNHLDNLTTSAGVALTATDIYFRDNSLINCLGSISLSGRPIAQAFSNGNIVSWGTAAPTTGSWRRGDIVGNTSLTTAQKEGWGCTASGTFSAAATTGDTDGATALMTNVADTSAIPINSYVSVAAGFATTGPFKVLRKTTHTLTLDTNSNAAQVGTAITTTDPTFVELANIK